MSKKGLFWLCLLALTSSLCMAQDRGLTVTSTTNWGKEHIHSMITLDTQKNGIRLPAGRNTALQILEMESPALLKDTFFSLQIDSTNQLGNYVENGTIHLSELTDLIELSPRTPPWFSRDLETISMTRTVPLSKIASLFVRHTRAQPVPHPLQKEPTHAFTGILIDARGQLPVHGEYTDETIQPCLFPKIWDTEMDLVYERNMIEPDIARSRGVVFYTDSADERIYRDRIGNDPLRITARGVFGRARTDPIISRSDYLKIASSPENRELLSQGKVVIICDAKTLERSRLGPAKNFDYYFVWKEIERTLAVTPVQRMVFRDAWQGLKITMYDIRFVADTAQIIEAERGRISIVADALKLAGPRATFLVEGHTASVGKPTGELNLSKERANKIAEELSQRGIPRERITIEGYGGTQPQDTNETDAGRAKNRRVEITIHLPEQNHQD